MILSPAEANVEPSGLNSTASTSASCPVRLTRTLPVSPSRRRTVFPSQEATNLPSGLNTADVLQWSEKEARSFPVATSQTRHTPSYPTETSDFPSGRKAADRTPAPSPPRVAVGLPVRTSHNRPV